MRAEQRDDARVAASSSGFDSWDGGGCLSTDDVLAHVDQRLEGTRLQSVRDHLDECAACRVVMAEAARLATSSAGAPRTLRTLADGEIVAGRYEVRRFVARGGMGEVYEAFDSALGETIALKTLLVTAIDQADAVKRLLAEVRIARKVTHPNVCRILEFGTHHRTGSNEPVPFLTMPLLRGETLACRLQSIGRLAPAEALRVLGELTAGLAAVHDVGVVHRDFKSDNVFLVRGDDGSERAVVMDFGLARALERDDRNKTTGRVLLGTPAYMAPEQVEGKPITKAVDVYALGVVAFEAITGRVPFVGASPTAVALARLQRGAVPPSSICPDLDRAWDGVIQRCLRRAPEQRYRSMAELTAALDRLRAGARRWPRRSVALAAVGLAIAVLGGWTMTRHRRARAEVAPAVGASSAGAPRAPAALANGPGSGLGAPALLQAMPSAVAPPAIKRARAASRQRRGFTPIASASPEPPASRPAPLMPARAAPAAEPVPSAAAPFARPAASRARQADDLVDPF
jgi:tRNA A-37 threonylcarbamoyl transferase component Bud32